MDMTAERTAAIISPATIGGISCRTTVKRIEAVGASGKSAFPYIPITTGIITNGISTAAAIIGDQNATFSSLQEAVRW